MRRATTYAAAISLISALVLPMRASPLAAPDEQVRSVAEDVAAACAEQTKLYQELTRLQQEQAFLRQMIANYGFEKTAAEFDAMADGLASRSPSRTTLRKDFVDQSLDLAKSGLESKITALQSAPDARTAVRPEFAQIVRTLPMDKGLQDQILRLADNPVTRLRGYGLAIDWISKFTLPAELVLAAEDGPLPLAWKGFIEAAAIVNPPIGNLLKVGDFALKHLYNITRGVITAYQIHKLTTLTEIELLTLTERAKKLRELTLELKQVNERFPDIARRCDTSRLTREQPLNTAQPPPPPAPKKGLFSGSNGLLLTTALAGGASLIALQTLKPKDCGDGPSLDEYYELCDRFPSGAACSSIKREHTEWCKCAGYTGFDDVGVCY